MSELKLKLAAGTNVGLVRQNNEDNFTVCANLAQSDWIIPQVGDYADLGGYGALLVVADGMGGANAGEVASAIAVETIQQMFAPDNLSELVGDDQLIQQYMKTAVIEASSNIVEKSNMDPSTKGMGTTIVMAWLLGRRAYICWCGDSRCYVLSKRKGLGRLSKDHSYVQTLVDRGELHPDLAIEHPLSNVITRCLGNSDNPAEPDTVIYELHNGDVLLLCSDGLCGLCPDIQIETLLNEHKEDIAICKEELISAALSAGGHDNVTVALCSIKIDGEEELEQTEGKEKEDDTSVVEKKELSSTVRNQTTSKNGRGSKVVVFVVVLIAIVVMAAIIYYLGIWHKLDQFMHQ